MGNTTSEVASGVKAQINSGGQGPELYRFVDFKVNSRLIIFLRKIFKIIFFRVVGNSLMLCV
jgi:hypothetical protein